MKKRKTKADEILTDPEIQRTLALGRTADELREVTILSSLLRGLRGRVMPRLRKQKCAVVVHRDPRDVARRFLRRFLGGQWHVGGNHIARMNYGPGIAFDAEWRNDRASEVKAWLINVPLAWDVSKE